MYMYVNIQLYIINRLESNHMAMWTIKIDFLNKTVPSIYNICYLRSSILTLSGYKPM